MKYKMGTCKGCKADKIPLVESHIIPEFLCRDGRNLKDKRYEADYESKKWRVIQSGIKERFLCDSCEKQYGEVDRYASTIFKLSGPRDLSIRIEDLGEYPDLKTRLEQWSGIDFKKCQRFVFSVLQRMVLSGMDKPEPLLYSDELEKMMNVYQDESNLDDSTYPILISKLTLAPTFRTGAVAPVRITADGNNFLKMNLLNLATVQFRAGGYMFQVIIKIISVPINYRLAIERYKLCSNGQIIVPNQPFTETLLFQICLASSQGLQNPKRPS